nr:hypothetical protein 9 [Balneolaceae bacterium]
MEYLLGAIYMGVVIIALVAVHEWWHKEPEESIDEMVDLDQLYYRIWNGTFRDRVPAWYRVIGHIEATDKWHLMAEAKRRLKVEENKELSDSYVDASGQLTADS